MEPDIATLNRDVERETLTLKRVEAELRKVIVGQDYLAGPAAGRAARPRPRPPRRRARAGQDARRQDARAGLAIDVQRIQFTPDLLPGRPRRHPDLRPAQRRLRAAQGADLHQPAPRRRDQPRARQGPVGPARGMEERQVTLGDTTYPLPEPFMVLATQNPIEQEGTYPLAEAQIDRFMLKLKVGYPTPRRGGRDPRPHARRARRRGRSGRSTGDA